MLDSIQPVRQEMETIIKSSASISDEVSQQKNAERFRVLQDSLMRSDNEFKSKLKDMQDELNTSVYDQLSEIISTWSKENSINLVMGKMEVIFNTDDIDVTDEILEVIREKDLFYKIEIIDSKTKSEINSLKDSIDILKKVEDNHTYKV
jgi:Skp family chaperone for outer membrane proteins